MFIDTTLYTDAPTDVREEKEMACYTLLNRLGISYVRIDHDPGDTIAICHEIEACLGAKICKNLFLCNAQKTAFYLLMMPGDKPFRTKDLSRQIGSARLSFAPPEEMLRCLNLTPGSVSVLGLMHDRTHEVSLLIDRDLLRDAEFGCHPCMNTSTLKLATADLIDRLLPALGYLPTIVEL